MMFSMLLSKFRPAPKPAKPEKSWMLQRAVMEALDPLLMLSAPPDPTVWAKIPGVNMSWDGGTATWVNGFPSAGSVVGVGNVIIPSGVTAEVKDLMNGFRIGSTTMDKGELQVQGTLKIHNDLWMGDLSKSGALTQTGGLVQVTRNVQFSSGHNFGDSSYSMNGGQFIVGGDVFIGDLTDGYRDPDGGIINIQASNNAYIQINGNLTTNRGYKDSRTMTIDSGSTFWLGGSLQAAGVFTFASSANSWIQGSLQMALEKSRDSSVVNVSQGSLVVQGGIEIGYPGVGSLGGTGQLNITGGVVTASDLDIYPATGNQVSIYGGVLRVVQSAYGLAEATAHINAGYITGSDLGPRTVWINGMAYTELGGGGDGGGGNGLSSVSISAPTAIVEGETVTVTVSRAGGDQTAALEVFLNAPTGSASPWLDYVNDLPASVVIPAGEANVTFDVTTIDDEVPEREEVLVLTLASDVAYNAGSTIAAMAIKDFPTIAIDTQEPIGPVPADTPVIFTVSRLTEDTSTSIEVYYSLKGSAVPEADYSGAQLDPEGSGFYRVTIPAGSQSVELRLTPLNDDFNSLEKSIQLQFAGISLEDIQKWTSLTDYFFLTHQSGQQVMAVSSGEALRALLQKAIADNDPITTLRILGHGDEALIQLNDEVITTDNEGSVILSDTQGDITDLMKQALSPDANVILAGCHTGFGDNPIAQKFSRILPGRTVSGARRFVIRLKFDVGLALYRDFKNGVEQ